VKVPRIIRATPEVLTVALVAALIGSSCDRAPAPPPASVALSTKLVAELKPITQLAPGRAAHVAVDSLGNVFYTLETEKGDDGVMAVGENGIPRATQLTSANILALMGETVGGSGTIQDLVTGPPGTLCFYFVGGKGRKMRACVGQFVPRAELIRIIYDTSQLAAASEMGDSLTIARGVLLASESRFDLLLRHTDAWVVLRFDARALTLGEKLPLSRGIERLYADEQDFDLTHERYELSPGPGGDLLLVDTKGGVMWQVNPSGRATLRVLLTGLPRELSAPTVTKDDRLLIFAAESEPIEADVTEALTRRLPRVTYPALLEIDGKEIKALIGRDDLRVFGGFPAYTIRIDKLVPTPEDKSYVAYDQASGQLMRMRLRPE
jgi:hypothetical protein